MDIVKDPKKWHASSQASQERTERLIAESQQWSDAKIASEVNGYLFQAESSDGTAEADGILKALGNRTYPPVLAILKNTSQRKRLVTSIGGHFVPEYPFNRACRLLGDEPPSETLSAILPFLDQPEDDIRADAALVVGKIGSSEIVAPIQKILADTNDNVREYALMGLVYAGENHRLSDPTCTALIPSLEQLLANGQNAGYAASLLFDFAPARAKTLFLSHSIFRPDYAGLHDVLGVMAKREITAPHNQLLPLIRELEKMPLEYPHANALADALQMLGQLRQNEDRTLLESYLTNENKDIAEGAADGLLASLGLKDFDKAIWDKMDNTGYQSLNGKQRLWAAVEILDGEVNNGGWSQYFLNSSGDLWPDAVAGLKAMGSIDRLATLQEAVAKFGKVGPSTASSQREDQLSALIKRDEKTFESLEDRYFNSKEVVTVLEAKFVIQNAADFK